MANEITFELHGAANVMTRLQQLSPKLQKKGLRAASRKAMNIVRDAARENAKLFDDPETPNKVDKLIITKENARRGKREGGIVMSVGVRGGSKSAKDKLHPWYWRLRELGSEKQAADPFMRPALEQNIDIVTDKFISEMNSEIDKLMQGN